MTDPIFIYFWLILEIACILSVAIAFVMGKRMSSGTLFIAPAIIMGGVALAQFGVGIAQKAKAAKLARQKRPELDDNPYLEQQYNLTGSRAQQGLTGSTLQAYQTNADRGLSSSLEASLRAGGGVNNIADLYEGQQNGLRQLAMINEETKMRNVNTFLEVGLQGKSDQERDQFFLNQYAPFQDQAALSAQLSQEGMNNVWKGVNTGVGAAIDAWGAKPEADTGSSGPVIKAAAPRTIAYNTSSSINTSRAINPGYKNVPGDLPRPVVNTAIPQNKMFFNSVSMKWERAWV